MDNTGNIQEKTLCKTTDVRTKVKEEVREYYNSPRSRSLYNSLSKINMKYILVFIVFCIQHIQGSHVLASLDQMSIRSEIEELNDKVDGLRHQLVIINENTEVTKDKVNVILANTPPLERKSSALMPSSLPITSSMLSDEEIMNDERVKTWLTSSPRHAITLSASMLHADELLQDPRVQSRMQKVVNFAMEKNNKVDQCGWLTRSALLIHVPSFQVECLRDCNERIRKDPTKDITMEVTKYCWSAEQAVFEYAHSKPCSSSDPVTIKIREILDRRRPIINLPSLEEILDS